MGREGEGGEGVRFGGKARISRGEGGRDEPRRRVMVVVVVVGGARGTDGCMRVGGRRSGGKTARAPFRDTACRTQTSCRIRADICSQPCEICVEGVGVRMRGSGHARGLREGARRSGFVGLGKRDLASAFGRRARDAPRRRGFHALIELDGLEVLLQAILMVHGRLRGTLRERARQRVELRHVRVARLAAPVAPRPSGSLAVEVRVRAPHPGAARDPSERYASSMRAWRDVAEPEDGARAVANLRARRMCVRKTTGQPVHTYEYRYRPLRVSERSARYAMADTACAAEGAPAGSVGRIGNRNDEL